MLAGAGYVVMGAGVPMKIPGVLDLFVNHEAATYPLHVTGAEAGDDTTLRFDPRDYKEGALAPLVRPRFLAIVASHVLAATLLAKANVRVDGFIVEGATAGGHNAPPRGRLQLSTAGEPIYGERDRVDLGQMRGLGRPFWLAGGYGARGHLQGARAEGAAGVQVGTACPTIRVDFQGSQVTSNGGLRLVREVDERLGFGELAAQCLTEWLATFCWVAPCDARTVSITRLWVGFDWRHTSGTAARCPAHLLDYATWFKRPSGASCDGRRRRGWQRRRPSAGSWRRRAAAAAGGRTVARSRHPARCICP